MHAAYASWPNELIMTEKNSEMKLKRKSTIEVQCYIPFNLTILSLLFPTLTPPTSYLTYLQHFLLQFPLLYFLFLSPDTCTEYLCIPFHSPLFHQTQYLCCLLLPLDTHFTHMQHFSLTLVLLCMQPHLNSYINYPSSRVDLSSLFVSYQIPGNILLLSSSLSTYWNLLNLDCWWFC